LSPRFLCVLGVSAFNPSSFSCWIPTTGYSLLVFPLRVCDLPFTIRFMQQMDSNVKAILDKGVAIPAHPLALNSSRKLDERRQRALSRYYIAAGAGGLAVGVHTTQFEIRDPRIGLFEPVLKLAAEEMSRADASRKEKLIRIG